MFVDRRIKTRRKHLDRQRRRTKTGLPGLARKTISENTDIHTMKAKTNRRHSSVTTRTILYLRSRQHCRIDRKRHLSTRVETTQSSE